MTPYSVVIPTHNRAQFLGSAIQSVLADRCAEVVVVDDGSTDNTFERWGHLPVTWVRFPQNRGITCARTAGVQAATGEVIFFLDSDDICVGSSLRARAAWLKAHPEEWGLVGGIAGWVDEQGNVLRRYGPWNVGERLSLEWIQQGHPFTTAPGLWGFRRAKLLEDPFDPDVRIVSDTELLLRYASQRPIPVWNHPVIWVREHSGSISRPSSPSFRRVLAESALLQMQYGLTQTESWA